jgi:putative phosphoserine phosphatase/1-acylglycerol-3-phosphate O-acyltransferase
MENHLKSYSKKLVVFDLDRTLISVNSGSRYLKILYKQKVLPFSAFIRAMILRFRFKFTSMSVEKLHYLALDQMMKGLSLTDMEQHVDTLVDELIPDYLYLPAYNELLAARERGDTIVLFSSSADFIVRKFAAYFKIDLWESTVYGVDKDHRICKIAKLMIGLQKEKCLLALQKELGIPKSRVVVYTDSHDDIPLLLQAGEAVAVNPDRKLAKLARLQNWRVI